MGTSPWYGRLKNHMSHFKVKKTSTVSAARLSTLVTNHGKIEAPFFMPVATQGAVKQVSAEEMRRLKPQILLSNTYHLMLRPGEQYIKKFGGLHEFMDWNGPILTDSGGFQVFSLAGSQKPGRNEKLVKLSEDGVKFKSYIDGSEHYLSPERALKIQSDLGVDIAVCLDECVALPAKKEYIADSVRLTTRWAERAKRAHMKMRGKKPLLHCVIQGGLDKELRLESLAGLKKLDFDGYNIGGLSVGESTEEMLEVLEYLVKEMPADKPRYLMGVGYPEQIVAAVRQGVDMFDCVIPTREGRHGRLFMWNKSYESLVASRKSVVNPKSKIQNLKFYDTINITNSKFSAYKSPINKDSKIPELRSYSKAYLNYLFKIGEPLGQRLATLNNLEFYLDLMAKIRADIKTGDL